LYQEAGAMTDDKPRLPPGLALAWGVTSSGRRGPKPAHTVEGIVQTAIELADARGFAAVSLPRLAERIGVTTNALYRYVSSKDELIVLVRDAVWGEPPESLRRGAHWREAATVWVHTVIERYVARPWLFDLPVPGAPMTPNLLRWLEILLEALASTGLSGQDRLGCAMLIDGYAYSTANLISKIRVGATEPAQSAAAFEFLLPRLREHGFPNLAAMMSAGAYEDRNVSTGDIDFGLQRILDGIEVLIRTVGHPAKPGRNGPVHRRTGRVR
jgi:AcrR family transcriptional regulator